MAYAEDRKRVAVKILRAAKVDLESTSNAVGVCRAIGRQDHLVVEWPFIYQGVKTTIILWIDELLENTWWYPAWLEKHGHPSDPHSVRMGRLAWLDWMIEEIENGRKKV